MKWFQVGLIVEEELAEPVAEVLSRHAPGGVAMSPSNPPSSSGPRNMVIHAYLEVNDQLDKVKSQLERDLWYLGRIRPIPQPEFNWVESTDWEEAWKQHFNALPVGRRLRVQPGWLPEPDDDRIPIFIDPGMAFGTGAHPSTQLCLELLEEHVRAGDFVADLGCGSGILSIAAVRLGAARCWAYDTDAMAISVCQENAKRNHVEEHIQARQGSLSQLRADCRNGAKPRLIVANIVMNVLAGMLQDDIMDSLAESGRLIVSGVLEPQAMELATQAEAQGLEALEIRKRQDWVALVLGK